jgi:hypothetical protein
MAAGLFSPRAAAARTRFQEPLKASLKASPTKILTNSTKIRDKCRELRLALYLVVTVFSLWVNTKVFKGEVPESWGRMGRVE